MTGLIMKKEEYIKTIEKLGDILDQVLTFDVYRKIRYAFKTFKSYDNCLNAFGNCNNQALKRLYTLFHYDKSFYSKIVGTRLIVDGKSKKILKDVLNHLKTNSKYLKFIGKKDIKYTKSGKSFSHPSFIVVKQDCIDILANDHTFNLVKSKHYDKTSQQIIHNILLETIMTKKEKEQYEKEYAEGKHQLSLKEYEADLRKKKRRADKHRMTIAKRAARETMKEYAKLQSENAALKAEIEHLKELKDKYSDVEDDNIEYDELDSHFPNGIEEKDFDRLSDDCKARLNAEAIEEHKKICVNAKTTDQEIKNVENCIKDMSDIKEEITDIVETSLDYPNKKIFDYVFESYGTTDKIRKIIYVNRLMPLDDRLRFFPILDMPTNKLYVIDAKNNKRINATYDFKQFTFDVGNVTYTMSIEQFNDLKTMIADKFALPKTFVNGMKNNVTPQKFRKIKKDIENICGFEIYVK